MTDDLPIASVTFGGPQPGDRCGECGATYRAMQAWCKPPGVIGSLVCDCPLAPQSSGFEFTVRPGMTVARNTHPDGWREATASTDVFETTFPQHRCAMGRHEFRQRNGYRHRACMWCRKVER